LSSLSHWSERRNGGWTKKKKNRFLDQWWVTSFCMRVNFEVSNPAWDANKVIKMKTIFLTKSYIKLLSHKIISIKAVTNSIIFSTSSFILKDARTSLRCFPLFLWHQLLHINKR
jgi:hypothetical protein